MNDNFSSSSNQINTQYDPTYAGSMQQILSDNIGIYVQCDFLIGTDNIVSQVGFLYEVGRQYLVLYNPIDNTYVACDIYNLKFVTFLQADSRLTANEFSFIQQQVIMRINENRRKNSENNNNRQQNINNQQA